MVAIRDSAGNTVTTATNVVTMAVSTGGAVVGTATVTATHGTATFTNVGISGTAGTAYTLTFASTGLTSATQNIALALQATSPDSTLCIGGTATVLLLVDPQLRAPLATSITRFANDLCSDAYRVWLANVVPPTPPEIRAYLASALQRSGQTLSGAFLIGDVPHAYQQVVLYSANPSFPDVVEEAISFQYYADVNGVFGRSGGYTGSHPYSYDVHSGDVDWELWIGVLPMYQGSLAATVDALGRYFEKNHAYRTGGTKPPHAYLEVNELQGYGVDDSVVLSSMRDGTYAWTPFSSGPSAHLYFATSTVGRSLLDGYAALRNGIADFTVIDAHGYFAASGIQTIDSVETNPVSTIFYWSSGCAIGNLDYARNFLTSIIYSPTSAVLVAKGTTNNSGGMGNNVNGFYGHNIAAALAAGASFGGAILGHVNVPLAGGWAHDREFYFGTPVVLGDPTLRLRR